MNDCEVVHKLFEHIVLDEQTINNLEKELFWKNLDTSLLLLKALKNQLPEMKLVKAYGLLVNTIPQLSQEGVNLLETVFVETEAPEEDEEKKEGEVVEETDPLRIELTKSLKRTYQEAWLKVLAQVATKKGLIRRTLSDLPQIILPNFTEPLLLADFLLACLDNSHGLHNQVLALKGLFMLLDKHGLDCPKYYEKLYDLLKPQVIKSNKGARTVSIFSMDSDTKVRFLRLLDLSLRAPTLPSKTVASFLKRIGRIMVSHGEVQTVSDAMFCISLIVNLIKRHTRCYRLLHRKHTSISLGHRFAEDPYDANEADPRLTKALKSSLWELDVILVNHFDQRVRDYAKILKTELLLKPTDKKAQDFAQADTLALLKDEIAELDLNKEVTIIRKNLLSKNGQGEEETKVKESSNILGKRLGDQLDRYGISQNIA